jgi:hypothetical protein
VIRVAVSLINCRSRIEVDIELDLEMPRPETIRDEDI